MLSSQSETLPLLHLPFTPAASRPSSAVCSEASSLPVSAPPAAGAVVPALQAAFPQEKECAGAANARSAEESVIAEPAHSGWAHSGWAQADCSDALLTDCSIQADCLAGVLPDGSIPDGHSAAPLTDAPADCSAEVSADVSIPHGRGEQRCSQDAGLEYLPLGWLLDACLPEGCKALLPLWPVLLHDP